MLKAENLCFSYQKSVINNVSIDIKKNELVVLLGPNGSGKSTLMKMLAGLLSPNTGKVFLANRLLTSISRRELAKEVGYVAQETRVEFPLSVFEFILQGRFAYGRGVGFEQEKDFSVVHQAMELTAITEFKARQLNELSGGERQRVFLARALAQKPNLLLLDEPTANLDIAYQVATLKLLSRLTSQEGLTVLLITHEINLASEFADKILLLKDGKIFSQGSPSEVLTKNALENVFETTLLVDKHPNSNTPRITIAGRS